MTQEELGEYEQMPGAIYTGTTDDPGPRAREHERNGYSGKMYYARTSNMKLKEDKMLERGEFPHNKQEKSGQDEGEGYIYIIVGKKFS